MPASTRTKRVAAPLPSASSGKAKKVQTRSGKVRYNGWEVPTHNYELDVIDTASITPQRFYAEYVAARRPVVLRGYITDPAFTAPVKWTNEYLKATAGDAPLMVEERSSPSDSFGKGNEVPMTFRTFLDLLEQRDMLHYLTTQDVEADPETGRPGLMAPFIAQLAHDFPLTPALLGHLVPQNINVWMGNAVDGSTTGLHHDYHDNLYILLRGKKHFRLYAPSDVEAMYTRGSLLQVHENGRINYEGEPTTAYGADPLSEQAALVAKTQRDAEAELEAAEADLENGVHGAAERVTAAEAKLEEAMEAAMDVEWNDNDEDGDEDDDEDADQDADEDADVFEDDLAVRRVVDKTIKYPINFSRVKTSRPVTELAAEFPLFASAKATTCELGVGDMLYLPASWFHEVTSFTEHGASDKGHLALNYWYHPPDVTTAFTAPYSSSFWPDDFAARGLVKTDD
ncbi:hypothetical protein SDRG_04166 [Saprolegnia diclina VS20]|uniref:JmjC domain-containing protein n=1 Tax=Saprolegnia diclina (strain VS20) TaxID=1156394 RepID=T0S0N4_SAPDV|nr:hypothetical protein SDRG_04166 [Saprolegnia diclina VS20]EQC38458.1 hypothetical protein SDRG_04166 [Saprolegnia diclina VS20]|eukprot:XP_008608050.1 hypothetical protein SDRG_04166 [Saprolegnia diclina VS20]